MTRSEFIRRFISVHKCVGCGEILDYEYSDGAFCEFCRLSWGAALNVGCHTCFKPARECVCMPEKLRKKGALTLRKLFFYEKDSGIYPEIRLLYQLKKQKSRRLTEFAAECLAPIVNEEINALPKEKLAVVNVPRSTKKKNLYGFDHAQLLAKCLAKKMGLEYCDAFRSSVIAKSQKQLNAVGRLKNAEKSVRFRKNVSVDGKTVILVDDIVTTGASMSVCIGLLMANGATGVICVGLASKSKV